MRGSARLTSCPTSFVFRLFRVAYAERTDAFIDTIGKVRRSFLKPTQEGEGRMGLPDSLARKAKPSLEMLRAKDGTPRPRAPVGSANHLQK
jgi:hypothetical protein